MMKPTVENRLRVLEDIEEIRKLKARYCAGCDDDHNPDTLVALFAPDGSWEATGMGRHDGHEAIRKFFADLRASGRIRNSAHNVFNPLIEVDGNTATGHWRLIMLYTGNVPGGGSPGGEVQYFRIIGWYREEYVRIFGRWRFKSLYCEVEESAPYPIEASRID
jgi:hypothetical protein